MTSGLVTGVFLLYAHTIMPGLRRTDDRTFVGAFQAIDRAIINPIFMACFFGALVLSGVATGLLWNAEHRAPLPWVAGAFLLYLPVIVITLAVNVPRNDALKAAGDPDQIVDLGRVRRDFDEARWWRWNLVRVGLSVASFGCLLVALTEYGSLP
ncbi:DUF1772 domain-containing protein [Micromonospora sp. HM5-17]|nr:DUF1772 domain-containing protein [Micromonospora sp. HM5-17]